MSQHFKSLCIRQGELAAIYKANKKAKAQAYRGLMNYTHFHCSMCSNYLCSGVKHSNGECFKCFEASQFIASQLKAKNL